MPKVDEFPTNAQHLLAELRYAQIPLEKASEALKLFDTLKTGKIAFVW